MTVQCLCQIKPKVILLVNVTEKERREWCF